MKTRKKGIIASIVVLLLLVGALAGCGGSKDASSEEESSSEPAKVVIAGSTSVQPLSDLLAEKFKDVEPNITVEVQGGGSGQGIKAAKEDLADLGAVSRELNSDEKSELAYNCVIANDGIAVVINKDVKVDEITTENLKAVFAGEITSWDGVASGATGNIVVVTREEGSGTRSAFGELTKLVTKDDAGNEIDATTADALVQGSTGAVLKTVAGTPGSIGYVSLGSLDNTVKAVKVNGIEASESTVSSGDYPLSRPFIYVSKAEPTGAVKKWIDFVLSEEGQKAVKEAGFVPVTAK